MNETHESGHFSEEESLEAVKAHYIGALKYFILCMKEIKIYSETIETAKTTHKKKFYDKKIMKLKEKATDASTKIQALEEVLVAHDVDPNALIAESLKSKEDE